MLLQKDDGPASKSFFVSQEAAQKELEIFFKERLKAIVGDYLREKGTAPSIREITDKLAEVRLEDFHSWVKASKGDGPADRYADAARKTKGRNQSLFNQVEYAIEDRFIANPGEFIESTEYSPDAQALMPLKDPPLPKAISNQRTLEHYEDLEREYRSDWVAIPEVIILQGLITLGLDMVALGKKYNWDDSEIDAMLRFLPESAKPAILSLHAAGVGLDQLEGEIAKQGGTATDLQKTDLKDKRQTLKEKSDAAREALRQKANSMAGSRFNPIGDAWGLLRQPDIKLYLVNMKNKKGEYLFNELRAKGMLPDSVRSKYGIAEDGTGGSDVPEKECRIYIPVDGNSWLGDSSKRLDGLGAKLTAWFNHNLALQSKNIIRAFVLEPIFTEVAKGDRSDEPWAMPIHNALLNTKSKEFASGSASHEPPPSPALVKMGKNWYMDMVDANRDLDTNFYYFKIRPQPPNLALEEYLAGGVDYLAVIYPDMFDSMAKAMINEGRLRGESGTFHDALYGTPDTPGLFNILSLDNGKYELDDAVEKRQAYMRWMNGRKSDKDHENPDHPASWYLNLKSIRFTGTGADVPTRIEVKVKPPDEHVAYNDKAVVDVTVTLISGGNDDHDLITPGVPTPAATDPSAPTGTLMGALYRSDNGEFIQKIDGPISMSTLPAQGNRTESIEGIDRKAKTGAKPDDNNPKIERVYDFGVTTRAEDKYHAYFSYPYVKADGSFKIQAGVDLKDYASEEMQRSNAGTDLVRSTPNDYKVRVRKHNPKDVDWSSVDFGSREVYITGRTVRFRSTLEKVQNVPLFQPDGTTPILGADGQQVVKPELIIMPNPLTLGSRGVFTMNLGPNFLVPEEIPRRKLAIPVVEPDANGNPVQMMNTDANGKTTPRYQLLDELPTSYMPLGIIGIGMSGRPGEVDYTTGKVEQTFDLIAKSGDSVPLKVVDMDFRELAGDNYWFQKRLQYKDLDGTYHDVGFVTYQTKKDPTTGEVMAAKTEYSTDSDFIQDVISGKFPELKDRFVIRVTLDEDGALSPGTPLEWNWSGQALLGIALDAKEWAKADVQARAFLSYLTPWDMQVIGEDGKPGKTVPLVVREAAGSTGDDPHLILSYPLKDDAGTVKNIDVYGAYKKDGAWLCEPLETTPDGKPNFEANNNPINDYKLFLEAIGVLPKPEEKKDSGELRGGYIRRVVPRRARHG